MTANENDPIHASKATQPLLELQNILQAARLSDEPSRIHAALIEVVDQLITHAQKQARAIDDLRSDVSHKQGIVSKIDGGDYRKGPSLVQTAEESDTLDL